MNKERIFKNFGQRWQLHEIELLKELVNSGIYSFKEIGNKIGRTPDACNRYSRLIGLNSDFQKRKYNVNWKFWREPSPTTFYWAGFMAADGHIVKSRGPNRRPATVKLEISSKDEDHLLKYKQSIGHDGKLYYFTRIKNNKKCITCSLSVNSPDWAEDLMVLYNVMPQKTHRLAPPYFDNDWQKLCWLKGILDGDGSVGIHKQGDKITVSYCSCSLQCAETVKDICNQFFPNVKTKYNNSVPANVNKFRNMYRFGIGGLRAANMVNYMRNLPCPQLDRKWNNPRILEIIERYKAQK